MRLILTHHQRVSHCALLPRVEAQRPTLLLASLWQREHRALHSDWRPLQHRGPHTSHPANWGLALQPQLLAPNLPNPKSSTNLAVYPPLSSNQWHHASLLWPTVGLQHSLQHHMALELSRFCPRRGIQVPALVPTFQLFVVGISCGFLCQRGTITAVQQSVAVTDGPIIPSPVSGLELSAHVIYICTQILLNLVQQKGHILSLLECKD